MCLQAIKADCLLLMIAIILCNLFTSLIGLRSFNLGIKVIYVIIDLAGISQV